MPRIDELAALDVAHEALLGEFAEEDLGNGGAEDQGRCGVSFGDFGDVGVRVGMIDFVEGDYSREFDGYEGGHKGGEVREGPCLQGGFEGEGVEGAGDGGRGAAITGKLGL